MTAKGIPKFICDLFACQQHVRYLTELSYSIVTNTVFGESHWVSLNVEHIKPGVRFISTVQ